MTSLNINVTHITSPLDLVTRWRSIDETLSESLEFTSMADDKTIIRSNVATYIEAIAVSKDDSSTVVLYVGVRRTESVQRTDEPQIVYIDYGSERISHVMNACWDRYLDDNDVTEQDGEDASLLSYNEQPERQSKFKCTVLYILPCVLIVSVLLAIILFSSL